MSDNDNKIKANLSERDKKYRERSLNAPMWKVVLSVGFPLAMYQSLNILFTIFDTMMASKISSQSVSAVAYLAQLNFILSALGTGLAVGAGVQISRAYGEGDYKTVKQRVSTDLGIHPLINLDVENYREKQASRLEHMAKKLAKEVVKTKMEIHLENMNAYDRRIIHNALTNFKGIKTESTGEEPERHIVIKPE